MHGKPRSLDFRKMIRRKWRTRYISEPRPNLFRFRGSLIEMGAIARTLRLYGLPVDGPKRLSGTEWRIAVSIPHNYSTDRLIRLCNLIDRSDSMSSLVSLNVRMFRWLGRDRRQKPSFYRRRRRN